MKTYTLKQVSELTGLTARQVEYRRRILEIRNDPNKYSEDDLEQIKNNYKIKEKVIYYKSTETFEIYPSKMNYMENI